MESLGNKLKTTREDKGYTYDQVSQDTHIASRYLKALEEEDFSVFPGEPFLLGFLKNYGEFLGLDIPELLALYRAMKIQEEPVPVDQLLKPVSQFPFKLVIAVCVGLIILGLIGWLVYVLLNRAPKQPAVVAKPRAPEEYTLKDNFLERRLYQGDLILIPYDDSQYVLSILSVGDAITINTPDREVILDLGQEVGVDLNSDGIEELQITAAEFAKNESRNGVLLRLQLDNALPPAVGETIPETLPTDPNAGGTGTSAGTGTVTAGTTPGPTPITATGIANATVIFSSTTAYPFTLQSVFQGYCMFRWEVLAEQNRRERTERYYQKADELNIQAQNGIRIWVSNAATVKLQVIGGGRTVPLELGGVGEVVVAEVRWIRDDENRYRLVMVKL
ncbi:MAG: helix-turn-helix domain-containing protein [Treponema sp.]|jgi:cytoskeletal protein RodZ|nr:helix-turn-helix domain-containing protein [Treponema sp.]